jgi:hypothetical protein
LARERSELEKLVSELRNAKDEAERQTDRSVSAEADRLADERKRLEAERRANEEVLVRFRAEAARRVERSHRLPVEEPAARVFLAAEAKELAKEREVLRDEWARLEAAKDEFALRQLAAHADAGRERARRAAET